jgi:hypothetical protein
LCLIGNCHRCISSVELDVWRMAVEGHLTMLYNKRWKNLSQSGIRDNRIRYTLRISTVQQITIKLITIITGTSAVVRGLRKVANRPSCGAHPVKLDQEYQVSRSQFGLRWNLPRTQQLHVFTNSGRGHSDKADNNRASFLATVVDVSGWLESRIVCANLLSGIKLLPLNTYYSSLHLDFWHLIIEREKKKIVVT